MQTFTLSIMTWVLITGFLFIKLKTISFLKVALSKAYKTMLESTKKSAFVRFITVKFKMAHINTVPFPEFKSVISFGLIRLFFFNRKSNNFHLLANEFFRKFYGLCCVSRYDNFSIHKNNCSQIYKIAY